MHIQNVEYSKKEVLGSVLFLAPIFLAVVLHKIILATGLEVTVDRVKLRLLCFLKLKELGNSLPETTMVIMAAMAVTPFWKQHHSAGSIRCNHSRVALPTQTLFAGNV